jgi:hypothetical protein
VSGQISAGSAGGDAACFEQVLDAEFFFAVDTMLAV